jgi:mannose-6-phosphate isomerase-like protein (cupin superfamily)
MDESILEIRDFDGEGFKPLIFFGSWRVAMLRYLDELKPDHIKAMERHMETDEVFVLLCGRGTLVLGGNASKCEGAIPQPMETGRLYNVKCKTWHAVLLSRDASVLLVENCDTGDQNSEYAELSLEQRAGILETAQQEHF